MTVSTNIKLALIGAALLAVVTMPGAVFWLLESIVVGLFEMLELILDEIVEHFFHTSRHTTQIIVFYLMWILFMGGAYGLVRYCTRCYRTFRSEFPAWWSDCCERAVSSWYEFPLSKKIKMISGCSLGAAFVAVFVL
ncbi:MAG: hypothetical protein Kow0065_11950 [Methylomicrobium sp.]